MDYYNELDSYKAQWLRNLIAEHLIPRGEVDERSIVEVDPRDLAGYEQCHFFAGIGGWPLALELAGWHGPCWTGSCPCQPISSAGQRRGHADERHLWPAFYALIAECQPTTVFGEQVAGKDGREWLAGVRADLEHAGYACGAADLPAAGVGAPHIRQRLFWVAQSDASGRREGLEYVQQSRRKLYVAWSGETRGLADAGRLSPRSGGSRPTPGPAGSTEGEARQQRLRSDPDAGSAAAGGLGEPCPPGLSPPEPQDLRRTRGRQEGRAVSQSGSACFWSDAVWLPCRDGKARRIEPSIFPLAHAGEWGTGSRVGILRGAGDAIVPTLAAQFVRACADAI